MVIKALTRFLADISKLRAVLLNLALTFLIHGLNQPFIQITSRIMPFNPE